MNQHQRTNGSVSPAQMDKNAETVIQTRTPYPVDVTRVQLTTPKGSPAQMDTTEYPPEGQNEECEVHCGSEVSTTREVCAHADRIRIAYSDVYYVDIGYRYCPKCGEQL